MQLNRDFVKSLNPPLSSLLPHGEMAKIAERLNIATLTARNAIHGSSTNEEVIREAIKSALELDGQLQTLFSQIPPDIFADLIKDLK